MAGVDSLKAKLATAPAETSPIREDRSSWTATGEDAFEVGTINNHSHAPTSQTGNLESAPPARGWSYNGTCSSGRPAAAPSAGACKPASG
jgi:hypothetical protein